MSGQNGGTGQHALRHVMVVGGLDTGASNNLLRMGARSALEMMLNKKIVEL